jgi:hypothetical protein
MGDNSQPEVGWPMRPPPPTRILAIRYAPRGIIARIFVPGLLEELKRRNVFQVGIAYLALAWLVIQVTDRAVPALHLPDSLNSIVFYIGVVGFAFALFFACAFELTPEGIKRESEVEPAESIAPAGIPERERSIAVLPFRNRSALEDDAYFVDGIHDDILTLLTRVSREWCSDVYPVRHRRRQQPDGSRQGAHKALSSEMR